jgi:AcrR family transcriptional regulator
MGKPQDLRVTKTNMALTNAFLGMMDEMRFECITVNELCDRAMVRRATFYKHFADKYEFFTFIIREMQAKFVAQRATEPAYENPVEFYAELFSHVLDQVEESRRLIQSAMKSSMFPVLHSLLSEQIAQDIRLKLKADLALGHRMIASPEVIAVLSAGAMVELVRWWLTQETPVHRDSLKSQVTSIINAMCTAANQ